MLGKIYFYKSILLNCVSKHLTVKPLSVAITGAEHPFLSGEPSNIDCISYGSRPAANITWYHNGRVIEYETKRIKVRTLPYCLMQCS